MFAYRAGLPPHGSASHIFGSPTGGYMGLVCFRNGSLAREAVRDHFGLDWEGFSAALRSTAAGNGGALMLPWFDPEITPRANAGVRTFALDPRDASANVRAVVEATNDRDGEPLAAVERPLHAASSPPAAHRPTARSSRSSADVFDAEVYQGAGGNAACLGAALRAWHACALEHGHELSWGQIVAGITDPPPATRVTPIAAHVAVYRDMSRRYEELESEAAVRGSDRCGQSLACEISHHGSHGSHGFAVVARWPTAADGRRWGRGIRDRKQRTWVLLAIPIPPRPRRAARGATASVWCAHSEAGRRRLSDPCDPCDPWSRTDRRDPAGLKPRPTPRPT